MSSTPDTSFSSSAESPRGRSRKSARDATALPSPSLPSPQQSEPDSTHDLADAPYQAIWDHFCGLPPPAPSVTFDLRDQATFESLYKRLDRQPGLLEYFEGEIWKEWDADTGILLLRLIPMAHSIHEVTKTKVEDAIKAELDRISHNTPSLQPIREKIIKAGNSYIKKKTRRSRAPEFWKVPDGQTYFGLSEYRYPPFIVEVAYSQEEKDLLNTVKTYFRQFPGKICTILGIKIQWAEEEKRRLRDHSHAASVSLWITEPSGDNEFSIRHSVHSDFRDDKGQALPGTLTIPFMSFLPLEERDKHDIPASTGTELRLDFADLASYVALGEARQRKEDKSLSRSPTPQPYKQKRKFVFKDLDGAVTDEIIVPLKRQRTESVLSVTSQTRTRSQSRPRRSSRIQSRGQGSE